MRIRIYRLEGEEELGFTGWKETYDLQVGRRKRTRVYRLEGELGFTGWKKKAN